MDPSDFADARKVIADALGESLERLIIGNETDVKAYLTAITSDIVGAIERGDEILEGRLLGQMRGLAEMKRIEAVNEGWEIVEVLLQQAFKIAKGLIAKGMA